MSSLSGADWATGTARAKASRSDTPRTDGQGRVQDEGSSLGRQGPDSFREARVARTDQPPGL